MSGMRCIVAGAVVLVDDVATLGGAATITLGGAAVSTLGDAVWSGVVGGRPVIIAVSWQMACMCHTFLLVEGGIVCPSRSRMSAAAVSVISCSEAMGS